MLKNCLKNKLHFNLRLANEHFLLNSKYLNERDYMITYIKIYSNSDEVFDRINIEILLAIANFQVLKKLKLLVFLGNENNFLAPSFRNVFVKINKIIKMLF